MEPGIGQSKREIVTERIFDHPREIIFNAWTDPRLLAQWWGPKGFTNTFNTFELKPGGIWDFVMHGPDGAAYHNQSVFAEIIKPERIIFNHLGPAHKFQATITFDDLASKTRVTFRMLHDTEAECEKVKPFAIAGNEENFDRLAEMLSRLEK